MSKNKQGQGRFDHLSPAKRALLEKKLRTAAKPSKPAPAIIPIQPPGAIPTLSFAQERIWFMHQLQPESAAYNMHEAVTIRGPLQPEILEESINLIIARHDSLRMVFKTKNGRPYLQIIDELFLPLKRLDWHSKGPEALENDVHLLAIEHAQRSFDLSTGPLLQTSLCRVADDCHHFFLCMHHIIADEWSLDIFWAELKELYFTLAHSQSPSLATPAIAYTDFAAWQHGEEIKKKFASDRHFWEGTLAGEHTLMQLPFDFPRPAVPGDAGGFHTRTLSAPMLPAVKALAQQEKTSPFILLKTAFDAFLHRYTQQKELFVGTPVANRYRPETKSVFGLFLNTVVLRSQVDPEHSFLQLLSAEKNIILDAFAHQELPFEQVVQAAQPDRDTAQNPLFQIMFVYQQEANDRFDWPGFSIQKMVVDGGVAKFDLTFFVAEKEGRLEIALEYRLDLFTAETIKRMLRHFETGLSNILNDPRQTISKINFLPDEERQQLLQHWSRSDRSLPAYPPTVLTWIEKHARQTPNATAVVYANSSLTYAELTRRAQQLAQILHSHGVQANVPVGILMDRSLEMIVAILGVMQARGAYLPLDPTHPPARLAHIVLDSGVKLVLSQSHLQNRLDGSGATTLLPNTLLDDAPLLGDLQAKTMQGNLLAYIIYTSGSTGQPKGVMVSHQNLAFSTAARMSYYPQGAQRFLLLSSIAFDSSIAGIFGTLAQGGTLYLPEPGYEKNIQLLAKTITANKITHLLAIPSLYKLLLDGAHPGELASLENVMIAGEAADPGIVPAHYELLGNTTLYNEYGPTEGTVWSTVFAVPADWHGSNIPIGRPIPGNQFFVLDEQQQQLPYGLPGELYIGGPGIVPGYWRQPELTAERFIAPPWAPKSSERLYRTGDLVRFLADGNLIFLGRVDQQIKIRGYRVEIEEIETAIRQLPGVLETAVLHHQLPGGRQLLIAYLTATTNLVTERLQQELRSQLPEYMVPSQFIVLAQMPRTPNGKLDRRALPNPDFEHSSKSHSLPKTPIEKQIAKIWTDVLHLDSVGREDNFFALGGHSLLATQVISRIQNSFETILPIQSVFNFPTIAALAAIVEQKQNAALELAPAPKIKRVSRGSFRRKRGQF